MKKNKLELHSQGYVVHPSICNINSKDLKYFSDIVKTKSRYIFNGEKNDKKRKQCILPKHCINKELDEFIKKKYSHLVPNTWVLLYSKEGCDEQQLHTDYEITEELKELGNDLPLSALFSLMPSTKIKVKPFGSDSTQIINLEPGDLLIFRSDLIHAGCAYDQDNIRIHCFLDHPNLKRIKNRTNIIKKIEK